MLEPFKISSSDFTRFFIFGTHGWNDAPHWISIVESQQGFCNWIKCQLSRPCQPLNPNWHESPSDASLHPDMKSAVNGFFHCYFLVVAIKFPSLRDRIMTYLSTKPSFYENNRQLARGFCKSVKKFTLEALGVPLNHPLVRQRVESLDGRLFIRKKIKSSWRGEISLSVPPPHARLLGDKDVFTSDPSLCISQARVHEMGLIQALRGHVDSVPCGNPIDGLLRSLVFKSSISSTYTVMLPDLYDRERIIYDIGVKVLSYNLLACVVRVPIIHREVADRVSDILDSGTDGPRAVVCFECGHCLNFGKGKFKRANFRPTQIFYCRDQKEKQCNVCATTGRIYCSYCGGHDIRSIKLIERVGAESVFRAIIANNAGLMINSKDDELDFILPCIGLPACNSPILKRLTVLQLLYLTSSANSVYCMKCQTSLH